MNPAAIDDNFERIRGDLINHGLTYDPLLDDMLDHVCCMVEDHMSSGKDFESSYSTVLGSIPGNRLRIIQHQTLLNLDKKYQRMKKITYVFGLISTLVMILGALFKRMNLPGAGILFTVGVLMTVIGFLPLYFRSSYLEMKEKTKPIYHIVGYITLSLILLGVLFKSQHWPGAAVMLTVGVTLTVFGFLPFYFRSSYRELEEKKNPVFGIVGYMTLALLLAGALFKILHWPGAGIVIITSLGFLVVGFVPLFVVNIYQKTGRDKILLPYLVMVLVGISLVMLIGNVRMSRETLDLYRAESVSNEMQTEVIRERTAELLSVGGNSSSRELELALTSIHTRAGELMNMVGTMQEGLKEYVDQQGIATSEMTGMENIRAGRDVVVDSGLGWEFVQGAREFREMLHGLVSDPVILSQIDDHLHLTGSVGTMEYGGADVTSSPMIRVYYMNGAAAKGIALSEYVALEYLLNGQ